MNHDLSLEESQKKWHGTLYAYLMGFVFSLILTGSAFFLVAERLLPDSTLIVTIIGLGIMQATAQVLFFLHVGQEDKPRWETLVFLFMILVLLIIVVGTLWIMFDLHHRLMPSMTSLTQMGK